MTDLSTSLPDNASLSPAVSKTMRQTFFVFVGMWLLTGVVAFLCSSVQLTLPSVLIAMGVFLAGSLALFKLHTHPTALLILSAMAASQGYWLGPILAKIVETPEGLNQVLTAAGLTALVAVTAAVYVIKTRRDFSAGRGFLHCALAVLLVGTVASIVMSSPVFSALVSMFGAIVFAGSLFYGVSNVVNGEEKSYVLAAMSAYLDTLNFFIHLLKLLGDIASFFGP